MDSKIHFKMKMKIVRAKDNKNKLEVFDNRPFAIDVELLNKGFEVRFLDLRTGEKRRCTYGSRTLFDNEWKLCYNINDEEDIDYEVINYYQE